jgi:hypothetical protein
MQAAIDTAVRINGSPTEDEDGKLFVTEEEIEQHGQSE